MYTVYVILIVIDNVHACGMYVRYEPWTDAALNKIL